MATVDGAWFRMDRPGNTADVVSLLVLDSPPPVARIRQLVRERMLVCPRFRQRAVAMGRLTRDRWEDDPAFSLDRHLVEVELAGGPDALRDLAGAIATEPLPTDRPLWRVYLVHGPGTSAIVTKIHHCLADGFALVALLLSLADEQDVDPPSRHSLAAYRRLEPWLDPATLIREAVTNPRRAVEVAGEATAMAVSLGRMALLPTERHDALVRPLTGQRRVAWSGGLSLQRVRDAARLHGGTLNDIILAAVAGALRSHVAGATDGAGPRREPAPVRALVPVNLRPGLPDTTRGPLGNRFGLVYMELPAHLGSPGDRVQAVRRAADEAKRRPDSLVSFGILAAIGAVPALVPLATSFFASKASVVVTNVPGPRRHLHIAGSRVENAMFWVPHPVTLGLGISVLTYAGEVRIGIRADEAVSADPAALVRHFERELDALGAGPASNEAPTSQAAPASAERARATAKP